MITWDDAWRLAWEHANSLELPSGAHGALLPDLTEDHPFGWVFFWDSSRFLETGASSDALVGNLPFIVDRADGSVHGTRLPWRRYLEAYARGR